MTIRKRICKAIAESGESVWDIATACGLRHITVALFIASDGDRARLTTAEALAKHFDLQLMERPED